MNLRGPSFACALSIGMIPAAAWADCAPIPFDPSAVLCSGVDIDGFASGLGHVTVSILGTVISTTDALWLTGVAPTILNQGEVNGVQRGVVAPLQAVIRNAGTIIGQSAAAIDVAQGATITNMSGATIRSLSGQAIVAGTGLTLSNQGSLSSAGRAATVAGGVSAKVMNMAGGEILSVDGTALKAGLGLELTNSGARISAGANGDAVTADAGYAIRNDVGAEISAVAGDAISLRGEGVITNQAGARISSLQGSAIRAADGALVANTAATIRATGPASTIRGLSRLTVRNTGEGRITALSGSAIEAGVGLSLSNGPLSVIESQFGLGVDAGLSGVVTNSGTISGGMGGVALGAGSRLRNEGIGSIRSAGGPAVSGRGAVEIGNAAGAGIIASASAPAVALQAATGSRLRNEGLIEGRSGDAVDIEGLDAIRVENGITGEIRSVTGTGIVIDANAARVENEGIIRGEAGGIRQSGGVRLDVVNRAGGRIASASGTALEVIEGQVETERNSDISGWTFGVSIASGRVRNDGRIEARAERSGSAALHVAASGRDLFLGNGGEIRGYAGIVLDERNSAHQQIENAGRIEGTGGTAIRFGQGHMRSTVSLLDDSEIVGDVLFGASDDFLNIFDIASGTLIRNGIFDGGAGRDTLTFATSYDWEDILKVDLLDETAFGITVRAQDGASLFGEFRNFERFVIAGTARSGAELREAFIAPVPLPAGLPMLAAGIGLIFGLRRMRRP
ncbi:hypothetical protein SAMN05443432_103386 [Roseovarius litoreus]|uniref:VPLPA-CTERM protein sorting domain-containing protein n=2 Tax=Roseovarius litoreus TaxID=1155722 RepID=A0A1M7EJB3_9RHOB|nr:hypothetical protein SAMN05443432_103386 [Roseovarius litoreus]